MAPRWIQVLPSPAEQPNCISLSPELLSHGHKVAAATSGVTPRQDKEAVLYILRYISPLFSLTKFWINLPGSSLSRIQGYPQDERRGEKRREKTHETSLDRANSARERERERERERMTRRGCREPGRIRQIFIFLL